MANIQIDLAARRRKQYAEIDSGGAGLVKLNRDPITEFEDLTRFKTHFLLWQQEPIEVELPLLENQDGIIFYKNPDSRLEYVYYVNQTKKTVTLLNL